MRPFSQNIQLEKSVAGVAGDGVLPVVVVVAVVASVELKVEEESASFWYWCRILMRLLCR